MTQTQNNHIVYIGRLGGEVVYVGEGVEDRYLHLNSGVSHVYEANRAHFEDKTIDVEIYRESLTKEYAMGVEKELIVELQPLWNRTHTDKSKLRKQIRKPLDNCKELLMYYNKLALIYACADDMASDGSATVVPHKVDVFGGSGTWKMLLKCFGKKKSEDPIIERIERISTRLYSVKIREDWLAQVDIRLHEMIRKAKRKMERETLNDTRTTISD